MKGKKKQSQERAFDGEEEDVEEEISPGTEPEREELFSCRPTSVNLLNGGRNLVKNCWNPHMLQ